jgi:hypothetical protein
MLEKSYIKGEIHPLDLKMNVARYLDKIIDPIRNYFEHGENKNYMIGLTKVNNYISEKTLLSKL